MEVRMPERVAVNQVRIMIAVIPRLPGAGQTAQGKSGPNLMPKGVGDGKQVNIPVPAWNDQDAMGGQRVYGWPTVRCVGSSLRSRSRQIRCV
jgi:hypothetical protein